MTRRRSERSDANHPCRNASSSRSGHRTAAQVGNVLQIQPRADLAKSRPGGGEEAAQGTSRAQVVEPRVPLLGAGVQAVEVLPRLPERRQDCVACPRKTSLQKDLASLGGQRHGVRARFVRRRGQRIALGESVSARKSRSSHFPRWLFASRQRRKRRDEPERRLKVVDQRSVRREEFARFSLGQGYIETVVNTVAGLKGDLDRTGKQRWISVEFGRRGQEVIHEGVHFRRADSPLALCPRESMSRFHKEAVRCE